MATRQELDPHTSCPSSSPTISQISIIIPPPFAIILIMSTKSSELKVFVSGVNNHTHPCMNAPINPCEPLIAVESEGSVSGGEINTFETDVPTLYPLIIDKGHFFRCFELRELLTPKPCSFGD